MTPESVGGEKVNTEALKAINFEEVDGYWKAYIVNEVGEKVYVGPGDEAFDLYRAELKRIEDEANDYSNPLVLKLKVEALEKRIAELEARPYCHPWPYSTPPYTVTFTLGQ